MNRSVLLTAATEDTEVFRSRLQDDDVTILHYPLEQYRAKEAEADIINTFDRLEEFENIVHGSKRNAKFFVEKVQEFDKFEEVRNLLNLAIDQHAADYLEEQGIAAVHPHSEGKAIDLMEFMLRVRRIGETLYPCGDKTSEDLPGFLQELDVPVQELVLFTLEGPEEEQLMEYRKDLAAHEPGIAIFHSRRSVNRTPAAFQTFDFSKPAVISGDQAVSDKLEREDIAVDAQADGSWDSILKKIEELL